MKSKPKLAAKRVAKVTPGISRTTQITFIIAAIASYVIQTAGTLQSVFSMPDIAGSFSRWIPVFMIDSILTPLLLFVFAYIVLRRSATKVSRVFKATLAALIGVIMSYITNLMFMEVFRQPLGYGDSPATWTSPFVQMIPMVAGILCAVLITIYIFKRVKDKEFTASRNVQKVLIRIVIFTFVANFLVSVAGVLNGTNNGYMNASEALWSFAASTLTILVPMAIIYFMASKSRTKLVRIMNAMLYLFIFMFITTTLYSITFIFEIYMHEPTSLASILLPIIAFTSLVVLVVVHKLQKVF
jgi:hypothetical protein